MLSRAFWNSMNIKIIYTYYVISVLNYNRSTIDPYFSWYLNTTFWRWLSIRQTACSIKCIRNLQADQWSWTLTLELVDQPALLILSYAQWRQGRLHTYTLIPAIDSQPYCRRSLTILLPLLSSSKMCLLLNAYFLLKNILYILSWFWSSLKNVFNPIYPEVEFKEFERRLIFKPRLKYGWFHLFIALSSY